MNDNTKDKKKLVGLQREHTDEVDALARLVFSFSFVLSAHAWETPRRAVS